MLCLAVRVLALENKSASLSEACFPFCFHLVSLYENLRPAARASLQSTSSIPSAYTVSKYCPSACLSPDCAFGMSGAGLWVLRQQSCAKLKDAGSHAQNWDEHMSARVSRHLPALWNTIRTRYYRTLKFFLRHTFRSIGLSQPRHGVCAPDRKQANRLFSKRVN